MLDVIKSIENLEWTVEHHFLHIQNQHDFMRAWAVQFELAYTDFRVIQMSLQMDLKNLELLKRFSLTYENGIYPYEYQFAGFGLDGFNEKYGDKIDEYKKNVDEMLAILKEIKVINPDI